GGNAGQRCNRLHLLMLWNWPRDVKAGLPAGCRPVAGRAGRFVGYYEEAGKINPRPEAGMQKEVEERFDPIERVSEKLGGAQLNQAGFLNQILDVQRSIVEVQLEQGKSLAQLTKRMDKLTIRMDKLAELQLETTEKLD